MIKVDGIPTWSKDEYIIKSTTIYPDEVFPDDLTVFVISYVDCNDIPSHVQLTESNQNILNGNWVVHTMIKECVARIVEDQCECNPAFTDADDEMKCTMMEEARVGFVNDNKKALEQFFNMVHKYFNNKYRK